MNKINCPLLEQISNVILMHSFRALDDAGWLAFEEGDTATVAECGHAFNRLVQDVEDYIPYAAA
jgi:hypothetical protein